MTLVADRFIRFDDGTVRDLATGERVTLIEITLTDRADQVARRDRCLARLDAQARGLCEVQRNDDTRPDARARRGGDGGDVEPDNADRDSHPPSGDFVLVDFALVGESQWIEAWRPTAETAMSREWEEWRGSKDGGHEWAGSPVNRVNDWNDWLRPRRAANVAASAGPPRDEGLIVGPVVDSIAATLDGLGSRDLRKLYVKAPDGASLGTFLDDVAREVRARGFIPLSTSFVYAWPAIAPLMKARSIVLFGDARCEVGGFSGSDGFSDSSALVGVGDGSCGYREANGAIARAVGLLHRAASVIAAIVARVCDHVNVAALRLLPAAANWRGATVLRSASVSGVVFESIVPARVELAAAAPPQSVLQPTVAVSYADPNLPSLFPETEQIAQVAETATLGAWTSDNGHRQGLVVPPVGRWSYITGASDTTLEDTSTRETANESDEPDETTISEAEPDRATGPPPNSAADSDSRTGSGSRTGSDSPTDSDSNSGLNSDLNANSSSDLSSASALEAASRYPPLRLVERRIRSELPEVAAVDIPVVTTMVSGYGDAVDALVGRGRWAAASRALRAELAAFERRKQRHAGARVSIALGRLHLAMGEVGRAMRWFDRAGELASVAGAASEAGGYESREFEIGERESGESESGESGESRFLGSQHANARLIGEALRWSGIAALDDADLERSERLLRGALVAIGPEADPHQVIAIELSLARCLFWQGRAREIVLPSVDALPLLQPPMPGVPSRDVSSCGFGFSDIARDSRVPRSASAACRQNAASHHAREQGGLPPSVGTPERRDVGDAERRSPCRDPMSAVILRVERWRRAARLALAEGDLSRAGDAIARACRIACGDNEDDLRSAGCSVQPFARVLGRRRSERSPASAAVAARLRAGTIATHGAGSGTRAGTRGGAKVSADAGAANETRIREALRAACHLDAARLQFAIGDAGSGDAHLRACLALSRVPARTARVQLLQLARSRSVRTSEGDRRFARLAAALRQPRTPRLVRIQARYLVDPRARRAAELVTFLDRHGDTALAGHGHTNRGGGGSPMLEAFQDVLRICHETPDDLTALARVSAFLRDQLRATSVAIYGTPPGGRFAVAGSTRLLSPELAARAIDSGLVIPPTYRPDALDAAAPVRYGGEPIGAIVVRWSIDATLDQTNASALISAAAAAVSPHLRAALDRERPDAGAGAGATRTSADARAPARTLGLLGVSPALDTLRQTITRVASAPFHVLIEGESGSGKELVARALHQHGPRRHRRFCAVNCAALTDELLEAELFGHTRGAFTGALTERAGLFEEADGGTLFLDEIGELSPRGQAKLLRVIQDGETRRIGENLPRRVDTRIVAATNRSLRDEANAGQFRSDLLYRLDVIRITVPPLRARPEDVVVLARAFWDEAIARLGSRATLDPGTLAVLARYHWPGNVRELHNAIMALAVHAPPRGRVTPSLLPATIRARAADASDDAPASEAKRERELPESEAGDMEAPLEDAKRAFESRYIRAALARAGGSPSRAARSLGLTRQGLAKLIARLGLDDDVAPRAGAAKRASGRKDRSPL